MNAIGKKSGFIIVIAAMLGLVFTSLIGVIAHSVGLRIQLAAKYINSQKAYYLALTGVNFARRQCYMDIADNVDKPDTGPCEYSKSIAFISEDDIVIVKKRCGGMAANISSEGEYNGVKTAIGCISGDRDISLDMWRGIKLSAIPYLYEIQDNGAYILENSLPVTKWAIKRSDV